jgi:hypothetical protein
MLPAIFFLVIGVNLLWYAMKSLLKRHSYEVSWFFNHTRDLKNMFDLARKTKDSHMQYLYYAIPVVILILIPVTIGLFLIAVLSGGPEALLP